MFLLQNEQRDRLIITCAICKMILKATLVCLMGINLIFQRISLTQQIYLSN